jgi:hypothetical protein
MKRCGFPCAGQQEAKSMNQEPETYDPEDFFHGQGPAFTIFEAERLLFAFMELSLWTVDVRPIQAEARNSGDLA